MTSSERPFKEHQEIHSDEKPFSCKVCSQRFSLKGNLDVHSLTHTGEKPFQCFICEKRFSQLGNMRTHQMTHTGEKPYICDICGKGFTQNGNLKSHRLIHTGRKPYICKICGKSFAQKGNFETHRLKHMKEPKNGLNKVDENLGKQSKLFSCNTCGQKFRYVCQLNSHKLMHTEQNIFACSVCNKGFKTSSSLKTHIKEHKEHKLSFCNICGEEFHHNDQLKTHLKKHTDEYTNEIPIPKKKMNVKQNLSEPPLIFTKIKKNTLKSENEKDPIDIDFEKETTSGIMCVQRLPDVSLICDILEEVESPPKTGVQTENTKSTNVKKFYALPEPNKETYDIENSFHKEIKIRKKECDHKNNTSKDIHEELTTHPEKYQSSNNITEYCLKSHQVNPYPSIKVDNSICNILEKEHRNLVSYEMTNTSDDSENLMISDYKQPWLPPAINRLPCNSENVVGLGHNEAKDYTPLSNQPRASFFNCNMCGMEFTYMTELDHHMTIHFSEESIIDTLLNW